MKKYLHGLLAIVLCASTIIDAAPQANKQTKVASKGVTDVEAEFGETYISVKISTIELDIGKPSDGWPNRRLSSCTYSRFPCSPVEILEISVGDNVLFVQQSVYADLADVNVMSLRQEEKDQFVLSLSGGDASESYTVDITFDEDMVRERIFISNLDEQIMQRTVYYEARSVD